jgi:hypothetical protein
MEIENHLQFLISEGLPQYCPACHAGGRGFECRPAAAGSPLSFDRPRQ